MHMRSTSVFPFAPLFAFALVFANTHSMQAAPQPIEQRLVEQADTALVQGQLGLSLTLLEGAWQLSKSPTILEKLARVLTMTGQYDEAIERYEALLKTADAPKATVDQAKKEISRLKAAPAPFSDEVPKRVSATAAAKEAFALGLKQVKAKKTDEAIRFLTAALHMDPLLPGTYRVLGATYGKLGDAKREQQFLLDYLRLRPDGKIADQIRDKLKPSGQLATVQLESSYESVIWINGRPMDKNTPVKDLLLPPGAHTISFVNENYHIIRNLRVKLKPAQAAKFKFEFGILAVKLDPWARIRANGKDVGLWDNIGLPIGEYKLAVKAHDGSKEREMTVTIAPQKTVELSKW